VAMLRDKRPQVATPELFAGVIVGAHPKVIVRNKTGDDALGVDALRLFEAHKIDDLIVINARGQPVGLIDGQDLPKFKIV